jgi:hypothetical protein
MSGYKYNQVCHLILLHFIEYNITYIMPSLTYVKLSHICIIIKLLAIQIQFFYSDFEHTKRHHITAQHIYFTNYSNVKSINKLIYTFPTQSYISCNNIITICWFRWKY